MKSMEFVGAIEKIIFVDEENTRLSPLAAELLKMKLSKAGVVGYNICSRGNVVLFPEPVNPMIEKIAENFGISLAQHQARQLEDGDFTSGTLTIAIDSSSKTKIYEQYVSATNAFTLKELMDETGDIFFPLGANAEQYESASENIERLVSDLAEKLAAVKEESEKDKAQEAKVRLSIGSDHAGYKMKLVLKTHLEERGFEVEDVGCFSEESCDYPDFAKKVAGAVAGGTAEKGVLICGTGIGMSIAANKVPGIRAALVTNEFMAQMTREHNDANVLCMGARVLDTETAVHLLDIFLDTPFSEEEKHMRRISKLETKEAGSE